MNINDSFNLFQNSIYETNEYILYNYYKNKIVSSSDNKEIYENFTTLRNHIINCTNADYSLKEDLMSLSKNYELLLSIDDFKKLFHYEKKFNNLIDKYINLMLNIAE